MNQTQSRDGTPIAYWRSGSGPPLLLVHGTTADHQRWNPLLPYFEPSFTVIAMDRRGRGGSGDSPDYHILREAEDVAAVAAAVAGSDGQPVAVLGHSYGALCSLEAALLTDAIDRLILYEPPIPLGGPMVSDEFLDRIQALIDQGENEAALELFFREVVKMPDHELEVYRRLPAWQVRIGLAPTLAREERFDRTYRFDAAKFRDLQTPTLLLCGGDSPSKFKEAADAVHNALPNSRMVDLPGQQHVAMDTNPELFVDEVRRFLWEPGREPQG